MHGHAHTATAGSHSDDVRVGGLTRAVLIGFVVLVALGTAAGLYALWPSGKVSGVGSLTAAAPGVTFPDGKILAVTAFSCPRSSAGADSGEHLNSDGSSASSAGDARSDRVTCAHLKVRVEQGADTGDIARVDVPDVVYDTGLRVGEGVRLARVPPATGSSGDTSAAGKVAYSFVDIGRGTPLLVLALLCGLVVVVVARFRGALAIAGIGVAMVVLVAFVLPALLDGKSGFAVGLVAASAIMLVVLYLAHGPSMRTTTALVGTLLGIGLTAILATAAVHAANLTGLSSDDVGVLSSVADSIDLQSLLTCGVIIAGLGVLNDVTITQAAAVWELRAVDPWMSRRTLFATAMRIGRDHISSTVYTIVFAYAGATLPVLLLIEVYQSPLHDVLVSEAIAEEIVRTLASAIGLVLAVPVTTAIGVLATSGAASSTASSAHRADTARV